MQNNQLFVFLLSVYLLASCRETATTNPTASESLTPYLMVLGIAQDAGYPQAGCKKNCCRLVWDRKLDPQLVASLGIVVPEMPGAWLIDATPDFKTQLQFLEKEAPLAGIFLTHAHIGHYTGLMHLGREVMGVGQLPVYAMPRMKGFLESNGPWSQLVDLANIQIRGLHADSTVQLHASLRITAFSVPHRDEFSETAGYLIEGPDKRALFIPDIDKWEKWDRDIKEFISRVDYAFLDATFFANGEIPGRDMSEIPHPFVAESMQLFADLPAEEKAKIYFIHLNHTNPLLDVESPQRQQLLQAGYHVASTGELFPL